MEYGYNIMPELHKIKCPTLVVSGAEDRSTTPEDYKIMAGKIANSKLVIVPKASHTVPEEQSGEFNRITLEFFSQTF